jgi:hypothetical protein
LGGKKLRIKILERFKRKEKEVEIVKKEEIKRTELEILCGEEEEVYKALSNTMFLDPRKIGISLKEAEEKAKELEKSGDLTRAKVHYQIAGGLAIYEGNVEKVKEIFGKLQKLSNKEYLILKIPEKAIQKAQEYYKKYLKEE